MFKALEDIHDCRESGELRKLINIAEHELAYHFQIKSDSLMPRKQEFTTEICNLIGLAHLDKIKLKPNPEKKEGLERLAAIFNVPFINKYAVVLYVFGDQSTYRDVGTPDLPFLLFKDNISRLEECVKYAEMPIEKCHWYHEMGKQNLKQNKLDGTRNFARKAIEEARVAGSKLWEFLGQVLICKADVAQKNALRINTSVKEAQNTVESFGDAKLTSYIGEALKVH